MEEASGSPVEVLPGNLDAVNAFMAMATQWRTTGFGARTGLDYGVLPTVLRLIDIPRSAWADVFDDLRVMEDAGLAHMHKKKT
ncbi:MAG: DUF1799 domain-containing protein [Pseudomonadota bacterium]